MKCKNCGGELVYENGVYICESCGTKSDASDHFEGTEVFLCYVENDDAGRRTEDSIIAQDIYNTLERNKINTFYQRISASDLAGEELENALVSAAHNAKAVIMLGTSKSNFEKLNEKYANIISGKTIIPVYSKMNAYDIPKGISSIQALNYGNVGASVDLTKGVLNALGRSQEVDVVKVAKKAMSKKKKLTVAAITVAVLLVLAAGGWLVHERIKPEEVKEEQPAEQGPSEEELKEESYKKAVELADKGEFAEALRAFSELPGYKDSDNRRQVIYSKYMGYYLDEAQNIAFHLQIWENNTGSVEIDKTTDKGSHCKITESAAINGDTLSVDFNDSENNKGKVDVVFENDGLKIKIETTNTANADVSFGNSELSYLSADRSDKPIEKELTIDDLISFVETKTTYGMLKQKGLKLSFDGPAYRDPAQAVFSLDNTDIEFLIDMYGSTYGNGSEDDSIVIAVGVPQSFFGNQGEKVSLPQKDGVLFMLEDNPEVVINALYYYADVVLTDSLTVGQNDNSTLYITGVGAVGEDNIREAVEWAKEEGRYGSDSGISNDVEYDIIPPSEYVSMYQIEVNASEGLRLRTGPGTEYEKILTIPFDSIVTVYGKNSDGEWSYVDYQGTMGWVNSWYLGGHGGGGGL